MASLRNSLFSAAWLALLTAPAWANNPLPDEVDEDSDGGKAIDYAARKAATPVAQPPGYYEIMAGFWGEFLAGGYPGAAAGNIFWASSPETLPPSSSADLYSLPMDGRAESVLDQIDERQAGLPMVGMPGSAPDAGGTAGADATTQAAALPEESILDRIGLAPAPSVQPVNPDSAKPAVDQAASPEIVKVKGK